MERIELAARRRNTLGKRVKGLRRQGLIPAILYGHHAEPVPLALEERALGVAERGAGSSQLVSLMIEGEEQPRTVVLKETQRDSITRSLLHVDFQQVVMGEVIVVEVPLSYVGEPLPVAEETGILSRGADTLTVRCLPADLVQEIVVDLSRLTEVNKAITVADLDLPPGLEVMGDKAEVLVLVLPAAAMEEEEEVEEVEVLAMPGEEEVGEAPEGRE